MGKQNNINILGRKMMNSAISIQGRSYKICGIIGQGGAAVVYLAKDNANKGYALKMIKNYNDPIIKELVDAQIRIQKQFQGNKYVIQYIGYEKMDKFIYIVLELGECSLSHWIETGYQIWQSEFLSMACDVCQGLASIHKKKVIHRDIKPENIIKKDGMYKITDFGVSCDHQQDETISGTPLYWAPEILLNLQQSKMFTNKVDVWSFGVTAFEVYFKVNPFCPNKKLGQAAMIAQMKKNIGQLTPDFKMQKFIAFLKKRDMTQEVKFIERKMKNTHPGLINNLCNFFDPNPQTRFDIQLLLALFESLRPEIQLKQIRKTQRLKKITTWQSVPEDIRMFCRAKDLFYELSAYCKTNLYDKVLFGLQIAIWYLEGRNYGGINYVLLDKLNFIKQYRKPAAQLWEQVKTLLSEYYFYLKVQPQIQAYDKLTELRMHILLCSVWWRIIEEDKFFCNMVKTVTGYEIDNPLMVLLYLQIFSERNIGDIEERIISRFYVS